MKLTFEVAGLPAPKGSARAIMRGGRAIHVSGGSDVARTKLRGWNAEVMTQATSVMNGAPPAVDQEIGMRIVFRFPRPKGHFGKNGVKPNAPRAHAVKPDLDKLIRSTWDAMAGIVYDDDSRIHEVMAVKVYCQPGEVPGASITVMWPGGAT